MKLKYKKIILAVTMGTMCIGLITLKIGSSEHKDSTKIEQSLSKKSDKTKSKKSDTTANVNTDSKKVEGTVTNSPSPVDSELKANAYPEINELIKNYYAALLKCDINEFAKVVTDTSTINIETIRQEVGNIEEYKNIECYTKLGPVEGSYVVYVYSELKLLNINTLAPGMKRLYVCTAEDGKLYVFTGQLDDTTNQYLADTSKDQKVQDLVNSVNQKFQSAISSDPDLYEFNKNLNEKAQEAQKAIDNAQSKDSNSSNTDATTAPVPTDTGTTNNTTPAPATTTP